MPDLPLPRASLLAPQRDRLAAAWLSRTLLTYPEATARFLEQERDPFRNPVGQALAAGLAALLDELLGEMDPGRLVAALDPIVRMRAVQAFTARQAVGFVFLLKPLLRRACQAQGCADALPALEARVDETALLAFDLYTACRERVQELRAGEARRRQWLAARTGHPAGGDGA
ncbi:MAG: RsbRD N-terminal domain-containing protein [Candidatus Methylomirabilales bacterium]